MSAIRRFNTAVLLGASLCLAAPVSANLIVNGSFEQPDVDTGSWKYFVADDVDGWEGSNIEIWDNFNGVTAADGEQFAELNAHPHSGDEFGIYQEFATTGGQWYDLSFAYRARSSKIDETFMVDVASSAWTIDDHVTGSWSVFSGSFLADSNLTTLTFTTLIPETGTIGNFLDNIRVVAVTEPGTLALLGLGLAGMGLRRRK